MAREHLLRQLYLPDRFENLREHLGVDLVRVLVSPPRQMEDFFLAAAQSVQSRGRGLLVPAWAGTGTGKSTLANTLDHFYPSEFAQPVQHRGPLTDENLAQTVRRSLSELPTNERRVLPIVVDGREGARPDEEETAAIKRFLRDPDGGARTLVLWLETDEARAKGIADDYERLAGRSPVGLPLEVVGPPRESWAGIASETLLRANDMESLASLGVDPNTYDAGVFPSIGEYLAQVAHDFNALTRELLKEFDKPTRMVILFASESRDTGPLAQLTEGRRLGLVNGHALVGATPDSEIGRWWGKRMGTLLSTIVRLEARAFVLPPSVSVTALRRYGPQEIKEALVDVADVDVTPYWDRSDVGRFLAGTERETREARGNPSEQKTSAFRAIANAGGLTTGQDKELNKALGASLEPFAKNLFGGPYSVIVEQALPSRGEGNLVPDLRLESKGDRAWIASRGVV